MKKTGTTARTTQKMHSRAADFGAGKTAAVPTEKADSRSFDASRSTGSTGYEIGTLSDRIKSGRKAKKKQKARKTNAKIYTQ